MSYTTLKSRQIDSMTNEYKKKEHDPKPTLFNTVSFKTLSSYGIKGVIYRTPEQEHEILQNEKEKYYE